MERQFIPQHNVLVDFDVTARGAARVSQVLNFLARSRIRYAITESPALSQTILSQFWENIQYDSSVYPAVLKTRISNRQVIFSATHLRDILRLGTVEQEDGPIEYPHTFIDGAVQRMGYVEQDPASGRVRGRQYHKSRVFGEWRFIWHVVVTIFGSRKGGYDELSPVLMSAVLSLVYNKPYSFSKYIFGELVRQAVGSVKSHFLLYPRFCMLIIRHCLPNLLSFKADLYVDVIGLRGYNAMFLLTSRHSIEQPQETALFGHIVDPHYVAPPHNDWFDVEGDEVVPAEDEMSDTAPHGLIKDVQDLSLGEHSKKKGKRKMHESDEEEKHEDLLEVGQYEEAPVLRKSARLQWQDVGKEVEHPHSNVVVSSAGNTVSTSKFKPMIDLNLVNEAERKARRRSSRLNKEDVHIDTHEVPTADDPSPDVDSMPASSSKKQKRSDKPSPKFDKSLESRVEKLEGLAEIYMTDMTVMWDAIHKLADAYSALLRDKGQVLDTVVDQHHQIAELRAMMENLPVQGEKMEAEGSSKSKKKEKARGK